MSRFLLIVLQVCIGVSLGCNGCDRASTPGSQDDTIVESPGKTVTRAGVRQLHGPPWRSADLKQATKLARMMDQFSPYYIEAGPDWPQLPPPRYDLFLEQTDGTRIEYMITGNGAFVDRREGPRDELLRSSVYGWKTLHTPAKFRERLVELTAALRASSAGP